MKVSLFVRRQVVFLFLIFYFFTGVVELSAVID